MARPDFARRGHRMERIERAVAEALEYELLPSLDDPYLTHLHVLNVEAACNLSNLTVLLVFRGTEEPEVLAQAEGELKVPNEEVQAHLNSAEAYLRTELAGRLRMKRMPTLRLRFLDWPAIPEKEAANENVD